MTDNIAPKLSAREARAARCRAIREALGYSQREVARYLGCTQGSISHIENARVGKHDTKLMKRMARLYRVDISFNGGVK